MTNHLTLFIYFIYNLWKKKLKCISIFLTYMYIFKRPDLNLKTSQCIFSASKIPIFWAICIFILDICSTNFHTSRNSKSSLYKKIIFSANWIPVFCATWPTKLLFYFAISWSCPPCISEKEHRTKNNKQFDIVNVFTVWWINVSYFKLGYRYFFYFIYFKNIIPPFSPNKKRGGGCDWQRSLQRYMMKGNNGLRDSNDGLDLTRNNVDITVDITLIQRKI